MSSESFSEGFTKSFLLHEDKSAITFLRDGGPETEISYRELHQDTNRMANVFLERGVTKGDRVILFIPKSPIFVVAHLALQKIGAIAVPLNTGFKKSELQYLLSDAEAKLILLEPAKGTLISDIDPSLSSLTIDTHKPYHDLALLRSASDELAPARVRAEDPALIIYTSGTTGKPKGAILTQKNLIHDARNIIQIWEINELDTLCHALPLFHVHGLCFALHTALLAGARIFQLDQDPRDIGRPLIRISPG